jgi:SAM-dependent methyltransferase
VRFRQKLFAHPIQTIQVLWDHWAALLYDRWHGVEAGKRGVRVPYDPTQPKYIRWAFRNLPIDPAAYSFVDFGSGKGRVLIAAAERPFLRVVGVEYSKDLHEAAVANIGSAKRIKCRDTTSLCMDAAEFSIPETPCVLYFYNPFRGETMDRVLSNIQASLTRAPRPLFLVYVNPVLHDVFMRKPGMRLIKGGVVQRVFLGWSMSEGIRRDTDRNWPLRSLSSPPLIGSARLFAAHGFAVTSS